MNIDTDITPANVRRWIDTAATYSVAKPSRAKGQRIRYAFIPITLGIERTITDRFDAFEFVIGGHGIPILVGEIPESQGFFRLPRPKRSSSRGRNALMPPTSNASQQLPTSPSAPHPYLWRHDLRFWLQGAAVLTNDVNAGLELLTFTGENCTL